jgi:hypothetical protein
MEDKIMCQIPNKATTEVLGIRQTVKNTDFTINSDQTLKNTMIAKNLLKRASK